MMHWRERVKTLAGSLLEPNRENFKTNIFKKSDILENIYSILPKVLACGLLTTFFKKQQKKGVTLTSSRCFDTVMAQVHS